MGTSVTVFKAVLTDHDPEVRRSLLEAPIAEYDADTLRGMLRAAQEVLADESLFYAWPDCALVQHMLDPGLLRTSELRTRLTDTDAGVRRGVWLTLCDRMYMLHRSSDYFQVALEVLADEAYAYAWPDCIAVLRGFKDWHSVLVFQLIVRVLLADSANGLGARLASAIGLPNEMYPPRLPEPVPESGSVCCGLCMSGQEQREISAARCRQVATLVTVLSSPVEALRRLAAKKLVRLGPGVAGVLRQVRRTRVPGRRAALYALAEIGWDEVDPSDRAVVQRAIRVQQLGEIPEPVPEPHGTWYAVRTTDRAAVLAAFDLCDPVEVSMRVGFAMWNGSENRELSYREVFVTPALDGWILVMTAEEMLDESHEDAHRRCVELSRRFGAAHWYNAPSDFETSGWCVAEDGVIVRYVHSDDEPDGMEIGPGACDTDELHAWLTDRDQGRREPPPAHTPRIPDGLQYRLSQIQRSGIDPGEQIPADVAAAEAVARDGIPRRHIGLNIADIARRLSVGPETLGPGTRVEGTGVLAVPAAPHPSKRYGALPWFVAM
ncbi:hypothetical protein KO481_23990 [Nocardia sp. NEAU-G5]|uniref:DUF4132 domain-containing protein n=1 Tax=Nocardia albiluteola TaxID=2842303 RepID=A0ABS6B2Q8_9NOCA|nr:hypothetical protein [Nocardia albiluteola]MBU3064580.1 hypothetical protein [Nocardia albiluteola]